MLNVVLGHGMLNAVLHYVVDAGGCITGYIMLNLKCNTEYRIQAHIKCKAF